MTADPRDPEITTESIVAIGPEQVSSDLDGEIVVLSMGDARYYGLEGVAARIWELVREPMRVGDICDRIAQEYEVTADQCRTDVLGFLRELAEKRLIEVRTGG